MARTAKNFFKMEMLLLQIIKDEDCYGYQIVQKLSEKSNGYINIAEGTMYPILYKLQEAGYITSKKEFVSKRQSRIYYHITDNGIKHLDELYQDYNKMVACIINIMEK